MGSRIENLLFDIGQVFLILDYKRALRHVMSLCDPSRALTSKAFFHLFERDPVIAEYELGHISAEDFFRHFVEKSGFQGTFEQFREIWRGIFEENAPMIEFGRKLSESHGVYFLTNAGDLHVPYIFEAYPSLCFCNDYVVSCQLHALKPSREFYERALDQFGITAESCLFIDDLPENVAGAEACGIRSVAYTTADRTIKQIEAFLQRE